MTATHPNPWRSGAHGQSDQLGLTARQGQSRPITCLGNPGTERWRWGLSHLPFAMATAMAPAQASPSLIWPLIPTSPPASQLLDFFLHQSTLCTAPALTLPSPAHSPHVAPRQPWEKYQGLQPNIPACSGPRLSLQHHISLHPQTTVLPSPRMSPATMPLGLCMGYSFCLEQLPSLGSLGCSSSLCKISNITSSFLLCLVSSSPSP